MSCQAHNKSRKHRRKGSEAEGLVKASRHLRMKRMVLKLKMDVRRREREWEAQWN
jgi:hypothetical protein